MTRAESDAFADRIEAHWRTYGFGLWAVEVVAGEPFVGFVGLAVPRFMPPVPHRADPRSRWAGGSPAAPGARVTRPRPASPR